MTHTTDGIMALHLIAVQKNGALWTELPQRTREKYEREADEATAALRAAVEQLCRENFTLAAGQCIVDGGLVMGEYGHGVCTMKERAERAEVRLRECLSRGEGAAVRVGELEQALKRTRQFAADVNGERDRFAVRVVTAERDATRLREALQRYWDCDQSRDVPGDTPARQARAALKEGK